MAAMIQLKPVLDSGFRILFICDVKCDVNCDFELMQIRNSSQREGWRFPIIIIQNLRTFIVYIWIYQSQNKQWNVNNNEIVDDFRWNK